jgi:hypothetical protein
MLALIDWQANISAAYADNNELKLVEAAMHRIAVWSQQIVIADENNPALCFIREMQISAHQGAALIGLGIYKASAISARTMLENGLYYSYFRSHPDELATLTRSKKYYISKSEIIEYHKLHSPKFLKHQEPFGLIGNLEVWYSDISAVVHGQIPGAWNSHSNLDEIAYHQDTHKLAVSALLGGEEILHNFLLCTVGVLHWSTFSPSAKSLFIRGIAGSAKTILGFDSK